MDLPDPGIEPGSPAWQVNSLPTELSGKPKKRKKGCRLVLPSVFSGSVQSIDFSLRYVLPSLFACLVIFAWMVNTVYFILLGAE